MRVKLKWGPIKILTLAKYIGYGFLSPARDYLEERIDLNKLLIQRPSATFMMKVETDAMERDHIVKGSIVIIDKSLKASTGNIHYPFTHIAIQSVVR